jgi:Dolichyl-phosphate-mannose-protein mannosyltransferase
MGRVIAILFGAAFTVGTSAALGSLLLRRLRLSLYREEAALFAFLTGASLTSLAVFFLCLIHQARWPVFLAGGVAVIFCGAGFFRGAGFSLRTGFIRSCRKPLPSAAKNWDLFFALIFAVFCFIYFVNALAPETSPDGSSYHLGNVARMWRNRGFDWEYRSMYSYLSQGLELLFLVAYSFGRHSAAALVHFAFQLTLPLLIVCYGRRNGFPKAAWCAAVLVFASPVVGRTGSAAYNDLAVATLVFALFYLLQVWRETRETNLLILIGLLGGFAYGVKYTAALALVFAAGFLWWHSRSESRRWRDLAIMAGTAAVGIVPWVARDWIWVGNPVAPFANRWFPNPYFHAGMEAAYLSDLSHYTGIRHFWQVPWALLVRGPETGGILGPVFLLAPVAVLALRKPEGRRLLLAALVFAVPAYFNTGARFLIPALPFVSLAMALAFANSAAALLSIALLHAAAGWPNVLSRYSDPASWRVRSIPVAAALRLQPEAKYLAEHLKDYLMRPALETLVPPRAKVFSLDSRAEAYLDRTIVVGYESALGNLGLDLLAAPLDHRVRPSQRRRFPFLPVSTRQVRVIEIASGTGFWAITELHVYSRGRELARAPEWRVRAWPNGWDARLAFDNSYATRWSSFQAMSPGMFLAVDFGKPEVIDEVALDDAPDSDSKVQVEVLDGRGRWVPLTDSVETAVFDVPAGLRRAATLEMKARGIGYLLVSDSDFFATDMKKYRSFWGVTELYSTETARLYMID